MVSNGSTTDFLLAPKLPAAFIFATLAATIAAGVIYMLPEMPRANTIAAVQQVLRRQHDDAKQRVRLMCCGSTTAHGDFRGRLIAIVFGFIRPFHRHAQIVCLFLRKGRKFHSDFFQVQACHLFVELLG
jgi:hypothetical protein